MTDYEYKDIKARLEVADDLNRAITDWQSVLDKFRGYTKGKIGLVIETALDPRCYSPQIPTDMRDQYEKFIEDIIAYYQHLYDEL